MAEIGGYSGLLIGFSLIDGLGDVAQQGSSFSIKIKKELIEIDN